MAFRYLTFGSLLGLQMLLIFHAGAENHQSDQSCGESSIRPMRVSVRHIEANGIGYNQGYTTLEVFFSPIDFWNCWVPFLDLRGHVFNNGKMAANAGLGIRYLYGSRIYGANAYYDYRNTTHRHYNQVSVGLETLGRLWDFRINGYLPVGKKVSPFYDPQFEEFSGNSIIVSRKQEFALKGANAEAGYHWDHYKNVPIYFAAGPYYLSGSGKTAWGGELRAVIKIFEYVSVSGNTSYDSLFRWIGQGQLGINVSFGAKREVKQNSQASCCSALSLRTRSVQCIDRNEIIPVDNRRVKSQAIDPATGEPYCVCR